ncbi:MAG: M23 family metallopeptidase [Anaerolineae bacterium]|nr:M23 family metallopeptidase [Anaerolineae bacterium]
MTDEHQQRGSKIGKLALALLASAITLTCLLALAVFSAWPVGTLAAILQPTSTSTPTPTNTPTHAPTFTPLPTATPTHTPTPTVVEPQVHQWLGRPFGSGGGNEPSRYYPYGSTARGKYRIHRGADFPNPFGTPVFAAGKGRVIVAGTDHRVMRGERVNFYGQLVIIQLDEPYRDQKVYVLYGHLSKVHVRFLQTVNEGDLIGEVGMTGVAIGPHLHFEVRVGRNSYEHTRNPELWLRPLPDKGTVVGLLVDSEGRPTAEHPLTLYRSDTPDRRWQDATTYAASDINPDDEWLENFVVGDVPAGEYLLKTNVDGRLYIEEITVRPGEIARVAIEAT